jgi:glycerol kinase
MKSYILAIDAGTTSSRALIFDKNGVQIALAQYEFTQYFPKEGWVEHDPIEIWETQKKAIRDVLAQANISSDEIEAIGITNQRETTVVWDKNTGLPVYNAIVWQDRRTAAFCESLVNAGYEQMVQDKTGLVVDSYFSGTKINWILEQNPSLRNEAAAGNLLFGTIDTWLIWKLSEGKHHVTDPSNASRTMLFNIHTLEWDTELLKMLGIPANILPKVHPSSGIIGTAKLDNWTTEVPISGIAGDQQAALFGQICFQPGEVKNTYGTGCFCVMNTGEKPVKSNNKMLTTIAWQINGKTTYAIEGSVFIAGALIQWLRDGMQIISSSSEVEALAKTVENNGGLTFIPALAGLGAPYWDSNATGAIMGITRGTEKGHIARAALEAIAMRSREIIFEMQKDAGIVFSSLRVDGGACKNNLLMQIQSDLLNSEVIRPKTTETTALGAAFLAGLGTGFWENQEELMHIWEKDAEFQPNANEATERIITLWNERMGKITTK